MDRSHAREPDLDCKTAVLCWSPLWSRRHKRAGPNVAVLRFGEDDSAFACTGLAPFLHVRRATRAQRKTMVFIEAVHLMVRDRCDPREVHRALLRVEEYQDGLAEDCRWERFPDEEEHAISADEETEAKEHAESWADPNRALACSIGEALRGLEKGDHAQVREALLVVAAAAARLPDVKAALDAMRREGL